MKKWIRFGIWLEEISSQILLGFVVVLVFIAALTRYLGTPINWSVDIAQGIFVWVIYLGLTRHGGKTDTSGSICSSIGSTPGYRRC